MGASLIGAVTTQWAQGAYTSRNKGDLIVLNATVTAAAGNDSWTTFRREFTTAGYQVPAGKTLYLTELLFYADGGGAEHILLYGDTDVGLNAAAAPTNPVYYDGFGTTPAAGWVEDTAYANHRLNILATIPTGKYPAVFGVLAGAAHRLTIFGHLE